MFMTNNPTMNANKNKRGAGETATRARARPEHNHRLVAATQPHLKEPTSTMAPHTRTKIVSV